MIFTIITCLFFFISVPLLLIGLGMFLRKRNGQNEFDTGREYYHLIFPNEMSKDEIADFITAIGDNLSGGSTWSGVPTVVFEVWSSPQTGITYRIRVPWQASAYLNAQLRGAIPGIDVIKLDSIPTEGFQYGETIHMQNPSEELPVKDTAMFANRIVRSVQSAMEESDTLVVQTIIAHSPNQKMPPSDRPLKSARGLDYARALFHVDTQADHDEVSSRRAKQVEQNYIAITRIAARGKDIPRARHLVGLVTQAFAAERGYSFLYPRHSDPQKISRDIALAKTPLDFTMQLSVSELTGVIGWPIGKVYVAGLERGAIRHMPVPEAVAREGVIIGKTTLPPTDRKIAIGLKEAVTHTYVGGASGVGKSVLLTNMVRQVIDQGSGLILLERDGNLFERTLQQIPHDRMHDVIIIDTTRTDKFVGFNPLQWGKPEIVAGQFASLLNGVFKDAGESVYTSQLVRHGVPVLASLEKATLYDLFALAYPRTGDEKSWQRKVIGGITNRTYRTYWNEWNKKNDQKKLSDAGAFFNRMYEVFTPEATRYMLNQEQTGFDPASIVKDNKILLINLAGVSEQVASILGTMLVNAVWGAAKDPTNTPAKPNFMVLDEFQQFANLKTETIDLFATARKRNLGLIVATQYIERLDKEVQDAVMANARNKIIFTSSVNSANIHAREFAHPIIRPDSFVNLPAYTALARINTGSGVSDPITMLTYPEPGNPGALIDETYNLGSQITQTSSSKYGKTIVEIEGDELARRRISSARQQQDDGAPRDYDLGGDDFDKPLE